MDVYTKTLNDVRKYFYASEFELQYKINDVLDRMRKHLDSQRYKDKLDNLDSDWQKQNQEALERNKKLIKEIELTKAKLRSHYYYQPATQYFNQQLKNVESQFLEDLDEHEMQLTK